MRIKYPKAIQESEEDLTETRTALTRTESSGSGAYAATAQKRNGEKREGLCAAGRLQRDPADPLVGTLPGRGLGRGAQAAQASRQALAADPGGVGGLGASDANGTHRNHARRARLPGARVGHQLQERQVALVALQETSGQVEDRAQATQES